MMTKRTGISRRTENRRTTDQPADSRLGAEFSLLNRLGTSFKAFKVWDTHPGEFINVCGICGPYADYSFVPEPACS